MKNTEEERGRGNTTLNKPWRNADGSIKDDDQIRSVAKHWSASTWEAYLSDINLGILTEDKHHEVLYDPLRSEDIFSESQLEEFISSLDLKHLPMLSQLLSKVTKRLSSRQQQILQLYFEKNKTITEIATELGIKKQPVITQMSRATTRLKSLLLKELKKAGSKRLPTGESASVLPSEGKTKCL